MELSVIIPAYREAQNLVELLPQVMPLLATHTQQYEITVVDSPFSQDESKTICERMGCRYIEQPQTGYADAIRCGIENAVFSYLLVLDADGSQDISKIPEMIAFAQKGYDVVIGSRYVKGGTTQDPASSVVMSRMLNRICCVCLGFSEKDVSTDFRLYRTEQLKTLNTRSQNIEIIEEILKLLKAQNKNLKTVEVPVNYKRRIYGKSKRRLIRFMVSYIKMIVRLMRL